MIAKVDAARHAVTRAVRTAVEAGDRMEACVKPYQQAVGATGRPGFQDSQLLDSASLERFQKAPPRRQRWCDPIIRLHFEEHVRAEIPFKQHEFDQAAAWRENTEPIAAAGRWRQPRRITGQMIQERRDPAAGPRRGDDAVAPTLRNRNILILIKSDAIG